MTTSFKIIKAETTSSCTSLSPECSKHLDSLGVASGIAQNLKSPITSIALFNSDKSRLEKHILYILFSTSEPNTPIAYVKTGMKNLFLQHTERSGLIECTDVCCVLDFFVDVEKQRCGYGNEVFEFMLSQLSVSESSDESNELIASASKLAFDWPSPLMLPFLSKHYGLNVLVKQNNNFVVFEQFWEGRDTVVRKVRVRPGN